MDDKKKIPFLISSDGAWPRLPLEDCLAAESAGIRDEEEKVSQACSDQNSGCEYSRVPKIQ